MVKPLRSHFTVAKNGREAQSTALGERTGQGGKEIKARKLSGVDGTARHARLAFIRRGNCEHAETRGPSGDQFLARWESYCELTNAAFPVALIPAYLTKEAGTWFTGAFAGRSLFTITWVEFLGCTRSRCSSRRERQK